MQGEAMWSKVHAGKRDLAGRPTAPPVFLISKPPFCIDIASNNQQFMMHLSCLFHPDIVPREKTTWGCRRAERSQKKFPGY